MDIDSRPYYCSGCNELRQPAQFGFFQPSRIFRDRYRKRKLNGVDHGVDHDMINDILKDWVQRAGEEDIKTRNRARRGWPPLACHKREPLTVNDYLKEGRSMEECLKLYGFNVKKIGRTGLERRE